MQKVRLRSLLSVAWSVLLMVGLVVRAPAQTTPIAFGQTIAGSLRVPGQTDAYALRAAAGDLLLLRVGRGSGSFWPLVQLYDPYGKLVDGDYNTPTVTLTRRLPNIDGTYTIVVSDGYDGTFTGGYGLFVQRLNNPGNATALMPGETVPGPGQSAPGMIDLAAKNDTYTFAANASDVLLLRASRASGSLWPRIRVYDPSGNLVDWDFGSPTVVLTLRLPNTTGTYVILVGDGNNGTFTGSYRLYFQRLNNPGKTTALLTGQTLPGKIDLPAKMEAFTFPAVAGDEIRLRMTRASGSLWPLLRLYDSAGSLVVWNYGRTTAEIALKVPGSGSYTVLAGDGYDGTFTGDYNLSLLRLGVPDPVRLSSILVDRPAVPGSQTVVGRATGTVTLSAAAPAGGVRVPLSTTIPPAHLPQPPVVEIAAGALGATFPITTDAVTSPQSGEITASYGGVSLSAPFTVQPIGVKSVDLSPNPAVVRSPVTGTVTLEAPAAPGNITVTLSSSNTAVATVPQSVTVSRDMDTQTLTVTTLAAGTATITAIANGMPSKSVLLTVSAAPPDGSRIDFGNTVRGSIGVGGETKTHYFPANAGDLVLIRMASGPLFPRIVLKGPSGAFVATGAGNSLAEIFERLPDTGIYTLEVRDAGSNTGEYYLYIQRTNNPGGITGVLSSGVPIADLISLPGQMRTYTFSGSTGDEVELTMSRLTGDFTLLIRLYYPNGIPLAESTGAKVTPPRLTVAGTYTVLLGSTGTGTGSYSLALTKK